MPISTSAPPKAAGKETEDMKKYEMPAIEVVRFSVEDVITTSDDEFPVIPLGIPDIE